MQQHAYLNGNPKNNATAALFQHYAPPIFTFLRQQIASREDAEDILLDVFTAALEQPQFHTLSEAAQKMWLWRVARNKLIDYYRRTNRRPATPIAEVEEELFIADTHTPEEALLRQEEYRQLHATLQQLPPLQQEVLRLRFVHNLRSAEVAAVIGKSDGAVRMLLARALNLLRSIYNTTSAQEDQD